MYKASTILIYGRDASLIETRRWVLEHAQCQVLTTFDLAGLNEAIRSQHIDLFILCHSLTRVEAESALSVAHLLRPEMKNLVMTAEPAIWPEFSQDTILTAFVDPQTLISTTTKLLNPTQ